jgi:asparagine synthase (glutamine-hydrolysing)
LGRHSVPKSDARGQADRRADRPDYYFPTNFEIATSWVHGRLTGGPRRDLHESPESVLEELLRPHLLAGTTYVAFSGGRDSSAVLAVANKLARAEGYSLPIPVTERYPEIADADESDWQERVVRFLDLPDWVRIDVTSENDLLGSAVTDGLRRTGLIWPPALHLKANLLRRLQPGALLTGEGGDEVFGLRRSTALHHMHMRRRANSSRQESVRRALQSLWPGAVRRRSIERGFARSNLQPWLHEELLHRHHRLMSADLASEPLRWDRSIRWLSGRRNAALTSRNYELLAAEYGITLGQPFLDERFLDSFAHYGGAFGFPSRTAAMTTLFRHVLPEDVLRRKTKALFNRAFFGEKTRTFAEQWDGTGVDRADVDVDRLRNEWLSDQPSALSSPLLQSAWMAVHL